MHFQEDIYNWILKKNWSGFNNLEDIIKAYKPLFEEKYYHPCEINNIKKNDLELRQNKRFYSAKMKIQIETSQGTRSFKLIDISETGLSIMIRSGFSFFNKFYRHSIKITIGSDSIVIIGRYRHATLITSKRPYHKYGLEIISGQKELKMLLNKYIKKSDFEYQEN
jgi:hypothetical protein